MEWVEVRGRSVDVAVAAALEELGLDSTEKAEIKVIQEPEKGFLGFGGRDAVVQVKPRPAGKKRRRRRGGKGGDQPQQGGSQDRGQPGSRQNAGRQQNGRQRSQGGDKKSRQPRQSDAPKQERPKQEEQPVNREEQAVVVKDFLVGLLDAFGLEGDVNVKADEDIVIATVDGQQTEALVGQKAVIMQSVLELSRTVVQRQTRDNVRLRLDIAGYGERRREALAIYAGRLADQVKDEGAEIMLEPMNSADRKVIHDAIAELDGVRSYSEGEEPRRSVVISPE